MASIKCDQLNRLIFVLEYCIFGTFETLKKIHFTYIFGKLMWCDELIEK